MVRKHREVLHHLEIDLQRYVEREFIAWLVEARGWTYPRPQVGELHLSTNDASVEVVMSCARQGQFAMAFQLLGGRLRLDLSGIASGENCSPTARRVLRLAIINVLKTGGIDLLEHAPDTAASVEDVSQSQDVCSLVVPWPEWVAMWEADSGAEVDAIWSRVSTIGEKV